MSKDKTKSRRAFLTLGLSNSVSKSEEYSGNEKVKMLTPDGKLVEVDKAVLENIRNQKKTTNKDILDWREISLNKST